jgi:uncharacterized protein YodC (DUF2158 family)
VKKGELVRLKTGGPSMLIVHLDRPSDLGIEQCADCIWQAGDNVSRGRFPVRALEPVDSYEFCIGSARDSL